MNFKEIIGIDLSKETFDVRIHTNQVYAHFENSNKGFKKLIKWVDKNSNYTVDEVLFVFEHTGLYSYPLSIFLSKINRPFTIVPGLAIKRSLGISRGKDDKIDATKIALYGYRLREEIEPYTLPSQSITRIKHLLSLRERLVKQRAGYMSSLKEQKRILVNKDHATLLSVQAKMIDLLSKEIKKVEAQIKEITKQSNEIKTQVKLLKSIKGIGDQTALFLIVYTHGFTRFKDARKFASYCGIAPFPNSSGKSLKGRSRVSNLANKKLKSLLDMCAKSAIQFNHEMKAYYLNRIEKNHNRMSTINIIRNKLLARAFAVIQRGTPYVDIYKHAA